jgi:hypothetical protein
MTLRLLTVLSVLASSLFAQNEPLKTRMFSLSLDDGIEDVFFLNEGKPQAFKAELSGLGEPFAYNGPALFALRASAAEFSAEPPLPAPLASVALPAKAKLVLLIGQHDADKKIKLNAYDVSPDGFRAGDYRIFNFSDKTLSLILGESKFALKPSEEKTVSNPVLRDKVLDVMIQIAEVKDGKPKRIYASAWGHRPGKRHFVFLFNGTSRAYPVAVRRYSDYID